VLQQNLPPAKVGAQLNAIWLQAFDVQGIGRAVLGKNSRRASAEQRKMYMELFPKYVAKLYAIQFSDYSGETFAVKGSKSVSDGTVVNAEITQPRDEPIKLDFHRGEHGSGSKGGRRQGRGRQPARYQAIGIRRGRSPEGH
jgi:ABC-type transporter MlaC component